MEMLSYPFMQRALLAGVMVGFLASYYGVFVVQRGLSFLGSGLSHATFGGVALGLLLGMQPLAVAVPFTVAVALGITWVGRRTSLSGDTAVGIFFAVSMALGILFLSMKSDYSVEAMTYLFGSILSVSAGDLWITGAVTAASLLTLPLWPRLAYATFDRELAQADQVPVERDDYLLSVLIAVTVVVAVKVMGIMLMAAFLVIPAAVSRLVTRRFITMAVAAAVVGVGSTVAGLMVSYWVDAPSGATIILVQALLFLLALAAQRLWTRQG